MPKKSGTTSLGTTSPETTSLETGPQPATDEAGSIDQTDTARSYEEARDELAQVVTKLEAGGITLEESLKLWESGEQLALTCQEWLDGARERLASIASKSAREV